MGHLFFNLDGDFEEVVRRIFLSLGIVSYMEGESVNVLGVTYGVVNVFGVAIKIEQNCYDYEDDYDYMLSIRKDSLSSLNVDISVIKAISYVVARLIVNNEAIEVARETSNGIEIVH